ncbi:hypothetical protein HYW82_01525 [Candidatus Peregrinibacteria bacterium]|nr:hypothetical protein [Candidatus Peregrinibacteria bacterium]
MKFKAAMFDFDGTVTEKGVWTPSPKMTDALILLAQKMPIGFCTGRQLESFKRRGLTELLREIKPEMRRSFMKNLFLFAENGSIGYSFNPKIEDFEEFYRVEWPEKFVQREKLRTIIGKAVKDYGEVYYDTHKVVIVIRTNLHDMYELNIDEVYKLSGKIFKICKKILLKIDPDFEKYLHIGDSGIGAIICPADGDKDRAIKEFASFLRKYKDIKIGRKAREILAVGDRPLAGGNDYYFLNGSYGTAYTVGDFTGVKWPKPVMDGHNRRLLNSQGTLYLLNTLLA